MKHEYVKAVDEIIADDELKRAIIRQASAHGGQAPVFGKRFRGKAAMSCAAFAIILLLAIGGPFMFRDKNQADPAALFRGFTVTAYAADGAPIAVRPDTEFPLGRYSMFMSSVPGFPVTVSSEGAERIEVRALEGELLLWNSSDSKVLTQGNRTDVKSGETFYWSPLSENVLSGAASSGTLEITAYRQDTALGSSEIEIEAEDGAVYTAKLIDKRE